MKNLPAKATTALAVATAVAAFILPADASILWISDANDNIGQVDTVAQNVVAGSVKNTATPLTDIAFDSSGQMFGTTFTALLAVNKSTGGVTGQGNYVGESGMNALLGTSSGLLGASFQNTNVYSIGSTNAALSIFTHAPSNSSGDMAIANGVLYGIGVSGGPNTLMTLSGANAGTQATIHVGAANGPTLSTAFGLADDGTTLFGVAGTEVYSVDPATAIATALFDYSQHENGQNLGNVTGAAFTVEGTIAPPGPPAGVPEPASWGLLGLGLLGTVVMTSRRRR